MREEVVEEEGEEIRSEVLQDNLAEEGEEEVLIELISKTTKTLRHLVNTQPRISLSKVPTPRITTEIEITREDPETPEEEVAEATEEDGERIEIIQGENAAGEEIEVEIHHHSPRDDEDTQSLDGDDNDYKDEEPKEIFEEYEYDGFKLKWNKETNVLLDPDDDEVMGKMIEKDGEWVPEISE